MLFLNILYGLQASVKKYLYEIFNEGVEIRPFKIKRIYILQSKRLIKWTSIWYLLPTKKSEHIESIYLISKVFYNSEIFSYNSVLQKCV